MSPTRATGYLNDTRTKKIIVDRERAPLVKTAFERYATGEVTLDTLRYFFAEHKIRTRNGKLLGRAFISHMLSNPMYYGHFQYGGEIHAGVHEPIISKRLFDDVQAILNSRWKWSPKVKPVAPKAFLGLLRCNECGGAITAEVQKGHTYYRCTKKTKNRQCSQPYIREEDLDSEISAQLAPFALREDWADDMLARIQNEKKEHLASAQAVAAEKRAEIEAIDQRLQRLLDGFLDGIIKREDYTAKKETFMSQRKTLDEQHSNLQKGNPSIWLEPFREWVLTAKDAGKIAISGSLQEKRNLTSKVFGSNLVLDCKKARGSCLKPWSFLLESTKTGGVVPATGLEPVRCYSLEPESSASANSATRALPSQKPGGFGTSTLGTIAEEARQTQVSSVTG